MESLQKMLSVLPFVVIPLTIIITLLLSTFRYVVVKAAEAHLVITPRRKLICASEDRLLKAGAKRTYWNIPSWIPFIGRTVRKLDITIKELVIPKQETYEKEQARYMVTSSTKYRIVDINKAAETFVSDDYLKEQLKEIIESAIRAVTVQYTVIEARSKKKEMAEKVKHEIEDDLANWGLELVSFSLVDFQDTPQSTVISNISRRREVDIETNTRRETSMRLKEAREAEALAEKLAKISEIESLEEIAKRDQDMKVQVAQKSREVKNQEMEVLKVEQIKTEEINKEKAIILAQAEKEKAIIKAESDKRKAQIDAEAERDAQKIRGEGYKLKAVLEGEGNAEKIRLEGEGNAQKVKLEGLASATAIEAKGMAEAKVKREMAEALAKFNEESIKALTAEKKIEADKEVGVAYARALEHADVKVISTGNGNTMSADGGANIGSMIDAFSKTSGLDIKGTIEGLVSKKNKE
jgi:flotillin